MPAQEGLKYPVWLGLQNRDELHFRVGHFWLEWFPCTNPKKLNAYVDAVCGFLSGQYRVLEYVRDGQCYKARLQAPRPEGWVTLGGWTRLHLPVLWGREQRVISNA